MSLSVVELLKPRYKLVTDYPHRQYDMETILYVDEEGELFCPIQGYILSIYKILEKDVDKYPQFQKLPWWSDRKPDEMPLYLKKIYGGKIVKVDQHQLCTSVSGGYMYSPNTFILDGMTKTYAHYLPATREEYEAHSRADK